MGPVAEVAVFPDRPLVNKFLVEHLRLMTIGLKAKQQRPGLISVARSDHMAELALILSDRLMRGNKFLGKRRQLSTQTKLSFRCPELLVSVTGNAQCVSSIEPQKIFLSGTAGSFSSLDDAFFMRVMAGAAEDAVTVKGKHGMLCFRTLGQRSFEKIGQRYQMICPGGVSGLLLGMAVDTVERQGGFKGDPAYVFYL